LPDSNALYMLHSIERLCVVCRSWAGLSKLAAMKADIARGCVLFLARKDVSISCCIFDAIHMISR
jgi:hypothetical protein